MPIGKGVAAELNAREFGGRDAVLLPFLYRFSYTGRMLKRSHPRRMVFCLGLIGVLIAVQARAADTGNGSKNFTAPRTVPNFFSNEAGPMLGPASETQRGPLYMSQTYGTSQAAAQAAFPAPRYRPHVAMAEPRGRLIRGRGGRVVVAHHVIVHGRGVTRVVAHGSARAHRAYAVSRRAHTTHAGRVSHAASRSAHVGSSHRRARG